MSFVNEGFSWSKDKEKKIPKTEKKSIIEIIMSYRW